MFWGSNIKISHGSNDFEHLYNLGWVLECHSKNLEGGAKSVASKIEFLGLSARVAFLARAKFLRQPLVTYKTFVSDRFFRLFLIYSKKTPPHTHTPPHSVLDTFGPGCTVIKLVRKFVNLFLL